MREIKFRAWGKNSKEFLGDKDGIGFTLKEIQNIHDLNVWEFSQYTGLKDKNGAHEIYEGDLVKTPAGIGVVEWRNGCFRICWNDTDSTTLHDTSQDLIEVVGNMYESEGSKK